MEKRDIIDNQEALSINKDIIKGSRRISNYISIVLLYIGGLGFFLAGLSSYFQKNLIPFTDVSNLIFIPQGVLLIFYGTLAVLVSTFILLTVIWDIGGGYNEYNKRDQLVRIVRKGFPGKNREIFLVYPFEDIKTIELEVTEGLNPKRIVYLCTKDERRIPLTPVQEPLELSLIEKQATSLAKFLDVNLSLK
jgi:hypothetical protein